MKEYYIIKKTSTIKVTCNGVLEKKFNYTAFSLIYNKIIVYTNLWKIEFKINTNEDQVFMNWKKVNNF